MDFFDTADEAINEVEVFEQFIPLERFKAINLVPIIFSGERRTGGLTQPGTDSKALWINTKWFNC